MVTTHHEDTDFSKLVNLCPVKKFSLISTLGDKIYFIGSKWIKRGWNQPENIN